MAVGFAMLLFMAWGAVKDRNPKLWCFSGSLLGINGQTSIKEVDKGTEFLTEMILHEFKDSKLYNS